MGSDVSGLEEMGVLFFFQNNFLILIFFSVSLGLRGGGFEDLSENEVKAACQCQFWKDCAWSRTEVEKISQLPSQGTIWKEKVKFFKARICDFKEQGVFCCDDDFPIESELKILKKKPSNDTNDVRIKFHA